MTRAAKVAATAFRALDRTNAFQRGLLVTALFGGLDLALRCCATGHSSPGAWSTRDAGIYSLGLLASVALWTLFSLVERRLTRNRGPLRVRAVAFVSLLVGAFFFLSFGYRTRFDQLPSWQTLRFVLAEPREAFSIVSAELRWFHAVASLALAIPFWLLHRHPARHVTRRRVGSVILGLATCLDATFVLAVPGFQAPLPADANGAAAWVQLGMAELGGARHLVTPVRAKIGPQPEREHPNVLLIVHENLRADAVFPGISVYGELDARRLSPFASRLVERRAEGYFTFPRARTNSTATESSVPVILSGLDLGGASNAFGTAASVWSLGKASRAHTFLFSAQSYHWSHFDEFFFDQNLDLARTGNDIDSHVVNDTGIDDGIAVGAMLAHLAQMQHRPGPFVGVMHFSGTHTPYWPGPGRRDIPRADRFPAAVRYVDRQVERIMQALQAQGWADDTVVIATSDHGQPMGRPGSGDRLCSFHDETVRVPLWIRVPPRWLARQPAWGPALDAWTTRNVQNMDILPTIRDLLALPADGPLDGSSLPGRSLLRSPPIEERVVAGQSTCAFRSWACEGLFLVRGSLKVIADTQHAGPRLFDLATDPGEQRDLWGDPTSRARVLPWVDAAIRSGAERQALCRRIGRSCPIRLE